MKMKIKTQKWKIFNQIIKVNNINFNCVLFCLLAKKNTVPDSSKYDEDYEF